MLPLSSHHKSAQATAADRHNFRGRGVVLVRRGGRLAPHSPQPGPVLEASAQVDAACSADHHGRFVCLG